MEREFFQKLDRIRLHLSTYKLADLSTRLDELEKKVKQIENRTRELDVRITGLSRRDEVPVDRLVTLLRELMRLMYLFMEHLSSLKKRVDELDSLIRTGQGSVDDD